MPNRFSPGCQCCGGSIPTVDCSPCDLPAGSLSFSFDYDYDVSCPSSGGSISSIICPGSTSGSTTVSGTMTFKDKPLYRATTLLASKHWVSGPHCAPNWISNLVCGDPPQLGTYFDETTAWYILGCNGLFYAVYRYTNNPSENTLPRLCAASTPAYVETSDRGTFQNNGGAGPSPGAENWFFFSYAVSGTCSPLMLTGSRHQNCAPFPTSRFVETDETITITA